MAADGPSRTKYRTGTKSAREVGADVRFHPLGPTICAGPNLFALDLIAAPEFANHIVRAISRYRQKAFASCI